MHQPDGAPRPPLTAIPQFLGGEPGRPMGDDRNIYYAMAVTLTILFIIMSVVVWSHLN
jgi:hypothetical protein